MTEHKRSGRSACKHCMMELMQHVGPQSKCLYASTNFEVAHCGECNREINTPWGQDEGGVPYHVVCPANYWDTPGMNGLNE